MIIDAHAHAAGPYATPADIIRTLDRHGIHSVALCTSPKNLQQLGMPPSLPFLQGPNSTCLLNRLHRITYRCTTSNGDGNRHVANLHRALPDRVIPFLWVDPNDRPAIAELETRVRRQGACGITLHQAWTPFAIESPTLHDLAERAGALGLPVFIHLYNAREAQSLARLAAEHPGTSFIVAHMLGLEAVEQEPGRHANVYFDTSGSSGVRSGDILEAVQRLGDDHVLFGTDSPYAPIDQQIAKIDRLPLTGGAKDRILALNAARLLQAPEGGALPA